MKDSTPNILEILLLLGIYYQNYQAIFSCFMHVWVKLNCLHYITAGLLGQRKDM